MQCLTNLSNYWIIEFYLQEDLNINAELENFDVNAERQENYNYPQPAQEKEANLLLSIPSMPWTSSASVTVHCNRKNIFFPKSWDFFT